MHFKVDEDLPPVVAEMLRKHGYASSTVVEQGMGGWKDPELWRATQDHQQFLVTADKGFADIRTYSPGSHCYPHGKTSRHQEQEVRKDFYKPLIDAKVTGVVDVVDGLFTMLRRAPR